MQPTLLRDCKQKIKKNSLLTENMKIFSKFAIKKLVARLQLFEKPGVIRMYGKKPSEETDYEDFFSRFEFGDYPDGMGDFEDK